MEQARALVRRSLAPGAVERAAGRVDGAIDVRLAGHRGAASGSPVAGSVSSRISPDAGSTSSPPMKRPYSRSAATLTVTTIPRACRPRGSAPSAARGSAPGSPGRAAGRGRRRGSTSPRTRATAGIQEPDAPLRVLARPRRPALDVVDGLLLRGAVLVQHQGRVEPANKQDGLLASSTAAARSASKATPASTSTAVTSSRVASSTGS